MRIQWELLAKERRRDTARKWRECMLYASCAYEKLPCLEIYSNPYSANSAVAYPVGSVSCLNRNRLPLSSAPEKVYGYRGRNDSCRAANKLGSRYKQACLSLCCVMLPVIEAYTDLAIAVDHLPYLGDGVRSLEVSRSRLVPMVRCLDFKF